jgi:DNA-binding HxlR family transcriptional regulator
MLRTYRQYCPVAHALDLVGERWSLLVIRELAHGPLRYSDLGDRLTGCSTNVLATRLRGLEAAGVVTRRRLPPPAASMVYELTEAGNGLKPVLAALAHWGARLLGPPGPDVQFQRGWLANALRTAVVDLAPTARIAFRVAGEEASLSAGTVVDGVLVDADAIVEGDPDGFYHLLVDGDVTGVTVEGDAGAVTHLAATLARSTPIALA